MYSILNGTKFQNSLNKTLENGFTTLLVMTNNLNVFVNLLPPVPPDTASMKQRRENVVFDSRREFRNCSILPAPEIQAASKPIAMPRKMLFGDIIRVLFLKTVV